MADGKVIAKRITFDVPVEEYSDVKSMLVAVKANKIRTKDIHEWIPFWTLEEWEEFTEDYDYDTIVIGHFLFHSHPEYQGLEVEMGLQKDGKTVELDEDFYEETRYEWCEEFRDSMKHDYCVTGKEVLDSFGPEVLDYLKENDVKINTLDGEEITDKYYFNVEDEPHDH